MRVRQALSDPTSNQDRARRMEALLMWVRTAVVRGVGTRWLLRMSTRRASHHRAPDGLAHAPLPRFFPHAWSPPAWAERVPSLACWRELLDTVVVRVCDINIADCIYRHAKWLVELAKADAFSTAVGSPLCQRSTVRRKLLDTICLPIRNIDVALAIYGDSERPQELAGAVTQVSPLSKRLSVWRQLLDAVVSPVRDIYIALCIESQPRWPVELAGAPALHTPLRERLAGRRELLDPVVHFLDDVQISLTINCQPRGRIKLPGALARGTPPGQRLACG